MSSKKIQQTSSLRKKLQDYSYILNENIGRGYSSQVYKGRNDLTNEAVAIKVIDMKKINNEVHKNLLASQIEVLKSLKNMQNIIELYDIYNTKNNTYIITQLCDGGDLAKHISCKKYLNQITAVEIMNQILNGYVKMQSKGIIHRDLKPANIFMRDGDIKIADFGFAMKTADCKKYSSYNVGSPVYMPPQALNQNKYSYKSDIWALGVIFYQMLTGKTPWRAKTQKQLSKLLISVPIKKLLPPSISNSSQMFLIRTLSTDLNERMSPQQLNRYTLTSQKTSSINRNLLYSTEHSVFDGRNNNIKRSQKLQTSLNKNNINNNKKLAMMQTNQQFKNNKFMMLPKTAATVTSNNPKTQTYLPNSNKTINHNYNPNPTQLPTQKQINTHHIIAQPLTYDKKYLSKQLLSQIHFCRFVYKLIMRMNDKLNQQINNQLLVLKQLMVGLIFTKLQQIQVVRMVNDKFKDDFKKTNDYAKLYQIIQQYKIKYQRDLDNYKPQNKSYPIIKQQINKNILILYKQISSYKNKQNNKYNQNYHQDDEEWKQQVIVLDYLVTLRQLLTILQNHQLQAFHLKSKIETIVQGTPSKLITEEHLNAIRNKLKAIKII